MKIRYWILILALCLSPSHYLFSAPVTAIEINCQKSFYTPDVIRVKKGDPVVLIVKTSDVAHGFAIDEFDIAKEVAPGQPVKIEFTPDKTGQFFFYCVVRCGKKHLKMRGKLIVE